MGGSRILVESNDSIWDREGVDVSCGRGDGGIDGGVARGCSGEVDASGY